MDILTPLTQYIVLVFVITVHEAAHAWMAYKCGDPTAHDLGRVTLSPFPHMDPIGTVAIPLFLLFAPLFGMGLPFAIIGWGKPVPVNPRNFRSFTRDDLLVSLAGPSSNLIMTLLAILLMQAIALTALPVAPVIILHILIPLAVISFILFFFNMLPIPPLDGSHLLRSFLSYEGKRLYDSIAPYGFIIILVLINLGPVQVLFRAAFSVLFMAIDLLAPHAVALLNSA